MFPVWPVVAALGAPVVEMMGDAFSRKDGGEVVGGAAVFPRAGAGGDVDIAAR